MLNDFMRGLIALFFVATLAACNTMQGAGEDIEAGGRTISDTAEEVEDEISD